MRQVLSVSLPARSTKQIKALSKKRGFDSVSSYIKYLIDLDKDLISSEELWNSVQEARKEYQTGKAIKAKSVKDLL